MGPLGGTGLVTDPLRNSSLHHVQHGTWTVIPHAGVEVFHELGGNVAIAVSLTGEATLPGGVWRVRRHQQ